MIDVLTSRTETFSRSALAIIYVWFGALKVFGVSPASPLVVALSAFMLPFMSAHTFGIAFGMFEIFLGVLFLFRRCTVLALVLFSLHMIACALPLLVLPHLTWSSLFVPTMDGQYIIKNLALIALAATLMKQKDRL